MVEMTMKYVLFPLSLILSIATAINTNPLAKLNLNIPKLCNSLKICATIPLAHLLLNMGGPIPSVHAIEAAPTVIVSTKSESNVPLYFGVGCFWHVQHEFVDAERSILGRPDEQLTALAGYAGGLKAGTDGTVCYHNMLGKSDYGSLGYGEVVGMKIPKESIGEFSKTYFSLFKNGDRPDRGDRGPEYRSLVGVPGGMENKEVLQELEVNAKAVGIKLVEGKGDDPDTLDKKVVYIMDSNKFPFKQAEIYHQYHDGFMPGEQYPQKYNSLVVNALKSGIIKTVGCPDVNVPLIN